MDGTGVALMAVISANINIACLPDIDLKKTP
jgi:hypothetical protein